MENFKFSSDVLARVDYLHRPETGGYVGYFEGAELTERNGKLAVVVNVVLENEPKQVWFYIHNSHNDAYGLNRFILFYIALMEEDINIIDLVDIENAIKRMNSTTGNQRCIGIWYNRMRDSLSFFAAHENSPVTEG